MSEGRTHNQTQSEILKSGISQKVASSKPHKSEISQKVTSSKPHIYGGTGTI